ncbi:GntR family transcriptional regulator [Corynebacterium atypicum]|uniref:GntR family transcriptional regulator n=1 Tax=Corynebacterium atypicum TaxID=191610 RepID=A0ABN4DE89_9CORY|nr:FCD domain-containing protein [Corynebacterium atypicum]AIG64744.1 GntR family transcriptional regulator [Corynebacterium atypicum]
MRKDLVSQGIDRMLDGIAAGDFRPGEALPAEAELAAYLDVSRPTMREVIRVLADRGMVQVIHGRGTYLNSRDQWTDMVTLVDMVSRSMSAREVGEYLVEIRRMIEVGSCGYAARRATPDDLAAMRLELDRYAEASETGDAEAAAKADLAFHDRVFRSSRNPFLTAIIKPLEVALSQSRLRTSAVPEVRERAAVHHRRIFEAIERGDEEGAKNAMRAHMKQTREDIASFLN